LGARRPVAGRAFTSLPVRRGWAAPVDGAGTLAAVTEQPISFARGAPGPQLIPAAELAECAREVGLREGASVFSYGSSGGYGPLREWVAERHGVDAGRVVLTVGGLLGFVLYAGELLERRPGRVLVEAPSYDRPLKILARERAQIVPLPMDDEGLDPDALAAELARPGDAPSFLYTIPTFQNPSGRTLSVERRRAVAELAERHALPVLEDDPYGLVRFEGEAPPTLHELASGPAVTYTSSFSKTVAPGLRVGYFILPTDEVASFEERAASTYISPPFLAQAIVHELIRQGRFEPNLERVRGELRARRDAMLDSLAASFPEDATWSRPEGGYFVWLDLPETHDTTALAARAAEAGVGIVRGEDFFPRDSGLGRSSARLAYSYETPERIREGIARLAAVI
jgi:DNA-binding transcriptional MocR family regulator